MKTIIDHAGICPLLNIDRQAIKELPENRPAGHNNEEENGEFHVLQGQVDIYKTFFTDCENVSISGFCSGSL